MTKKPIQNSGESPTDKNTSVGHWLNERCEWEGAKHPFDQQSEKHSILFAEKPAVEITLSEKGYSLATLSLIYAFWS